MKHVKDCFQRIDWTDLAAAAVFALHLFIVFDLLMPTLREVNLWDESVYANTGRLLAKGRMTPFSRNPLVGALYALTYLPFASSDFWLVESISLGRVILFTLLWWAGYLVFREVRTNASPLVMAGVMFTSPVLADIVRNQSDALFAALSGFALWQMLRYFHQRQTRNLAYASLILGLAALARNDGLVLFVLFVGLALWLSWGRPQFWLRLAAAGLPFLAVVGGYVLAYGLITGSFEQGLMSRSYVAFLQGQASGYSSEDCALSEMACGMQAVEELYGVELQGENPSVFRAILNNPQAFFNRVWTSIKVLPGLFYVGYGKLNVILVAVLALAGMLELIRKKQPALLIVMLVWSAYLNVYFLTFFRRGYLQMVYFVVLALVGLGALALASGLHLKRERQAWTGLLGALTVLGLAIGNQTLYLSAILLLAVIWISFLSQKNGTGVSRQAAQTGLLLLLAAGVLLNVDLNPPVRYQPGEQAEEHAVAAIQAALPPESEVAAGAPGWVWNANMTYVSLAEEDFNVNTSADLVAVLRSKGVEAIYVDHHLTNSAARLWALIEPEIGNTYRQLYQGREGSIRVLLVAP